jgi:hypothetical protein
MPIKLYLSPNKAHNLSRYFQIEKGSLVVISFMRKRGSSLCRKRWLSLI